MEGTPRRPFLISKVWIQAVILVVLCGFFVLGLLAYRTYMAHPPVPSRVIDESGAVLFTGDDISKGQQVFLHNGLMEFGSVFGHGAYLGPDFTADYLRRSADLVRDSYGGAASAAAASRTIEDMRANRYDSSTKTLTFSAAEAAAFRKLVPYYSNYFSDPSTEHGLRAGAITNPTQLRQMTAFFAWTAWAAAAKRPGHSYSYTNNWPSEPRVDNTPTANVIVWSVLSLIALLGGIGILFAAFGRWGRQLGWHGREQATLSFRSPGDVALTPGQRATAWFFFVMAGLFLIQTLVGAASQHYRADISSFFGLDLARVFPYNLMRTWHVQLAIFWVATSFVAAGIFLAPMIARREPKHQGKLAFALLGALAVVVFGTLIGSFLALHGVLENVAANWFGLQGLEYLDLARLWQILLVIGLLVWLFMLWRVLRGRLAGEHMGNMPWLFFLAACAIPAFYAVGLIARTGDNFTTIEFWRFWVVHLWVEDFLELFTTVMVAYMFVLLGVVRETHRAHGRLPRHHPLLGRRRDRHDAPPLLLRRAGGAHGPRRLLLGRGGDPAHVPDRGGMVVPPARLRAGGPVADAVPPSLGRDVPRRGRLLELPRRGHLRLPDQPADRLLLRDRHGPDGEPRPRGDDGRLRDAGARARAVLPPLPDSRRQVARALGEDLVLVDEPRPRLDVLRDLAAARHPPALQIGRLRLFRGT